MKTASVNPIVKYQFAGHETFPLRLLWLKKAFDIVAYKQGTRSTFQEPEAIASFGVGKNMALSMRHWAVASGILADQDEKFAPTPLATMLLDTEVGLDPYLEDPSTIWLIHSALAGTPEYSTTFFYAFNFLNQSIFDRETLVHAVCEYAGSNGARATVETIKRDVDVFLRNYAPRLNDLNEDAVEPLLSELGLISEARLPGQFEFIRGPKPNLQSGVFVLALKRFWSRWHPTAPTLSAELATYGEGSPGRVFKLDEDSVIERLAKIDEITNGGILWTDTAGLRQVSLSKSLVDIDDEKLIMASYPFRKKS